MSKKTFTIVGATGNQGISIIDALISNPEIQLRGITRNKSSANAMAQSAKGVEMVQADLNDPDSIRKAFEGSHLIFAITDFFEPFANAGPVEAQAIETKQGIAMAKAAAQTLTLEHYIWSTLPDWETLSGGEIALPHAQSKVAVDRYIRDEEPSLLEKTTFLWVTWYHSNFVHPMLKPYYVDTADLWVQIQPHKASTPVPTIGDIRANLGKFVSAIVAQPEKTNAGRYVIAEAEYSTSGDLLQSWAKVKGVKAVYVKTDVETYESLWGKWSKEMSLNLRAFETLKERSWVPNHGEQVVTKEDLGISGLLSLEDSFKTLNLPEGSA